MPDLFLQLRDADDPDEDGTTLPALSDDEAVRLLQDADFTASKLIPWGSNYTFGVALTCPNGREQLAIYKPRAGEAPLYDFPDGTLYRREYASYLLSRHLGWGLVPPTVIREGPNGIGSVQLYVEPAPDSGSDQRYWGQRLPQIERLVLFDHIANNADRKIGHCLRDRTGRVWGIDHGLTFHRYPKLRTVLWQFVGDPISQALLADLAQIQRRANELQATLRPYLDRSEIEALLGRIDRLLASGCYPNLNPRRNVPYGWW